MAWNIKVIDFRSRMRLAALVVTIGLVATLGSVRADIGRPLALRALAVGYSIWDPFSEESSVAMGPQQMAAQGGERDQARQLEEWFPEYACEVITKGAHRPSPEPVRFSHESLAAPRVAEFGRLCEAILKDATDIFSVSCRVRQLTEHGLGNQLDHLGSDPIEILHAAQAGEPLTCRPFALLYGSCLASRGFTWRMLGLSADGTRFDHAVVEVYVPEYGKWVLVDPDFNVAYRRNGEWLNAADLHREWRRFNSRKRGNVPDSDRASGKSPERYEGPVELVELGPEGAALRETNLLPVGDGVGLRYYENITYSTRNNYLSASYPKGHPKATFQYVLKSSGEKLPICPEAQPVTDLGDLYFAVGRSNVWLAKKLDSSSVQLEFSTWAPNFSGFEVRFDDGDWESCAGASAPLKIKSGRTKVEVRSVNAAGLRGEAVEFVVWATARSTVSN